MEILRLSTVGERTKQEGLHACFRGLLGKLETRLSLNA